ncbi:hypothetical protein ACOSP6_11300 [Tenacibaculum sp. MEBiC06402]|uniref:hypothetical protein n=1 Tax=unclassified Tenacibaculum TaxID=2635139 RepID=UPI003B99AC27
MYFTIKKGRSNATILFIATGLFLILAFSYQLFIHLKANDFIYEFPGDWDKPLGILVGIFLVFRSKRFKNQRKGLYINLSKDALEFRTKESENIQKIKLSDITKVYPEENSIILRTMKQNHITICLKTIKSEKEMKEIRKKVIEIIKTNN